MTVTFYIARFSSATEGDFHGSISWDKYTPRMIDAKLSRYLSGNEVDRPVWTKQAKNDRSGMERLVKAMKAQAEKLSLSVVSEEETRFAPTT